MKKRYFLLLFLMLCLPSFGQSTDNKWTVNYGIRGGFNSTMYFIDQFKVGNKTISEIQNNYKVGYMGALFMRVNRGKAYLQTELTYNVSKGEIMIDKLEFKHPDLTPDYSVISSKIEKLEIPLLFGYNLVKRDPYVMGFFIGPKLKYNLHNKLEFTNFDQHDMSEKLYPFGLNGVTGFAVTIGNVFFDCQYEIGLTNISKSAYYMDQNADGSNEKMDIIFNRKSNVLSFSIGLFL